PGMKVGCTSTSPSMSVARSIIGLAPRPVLRHDSMEPQERGAMSLHYVKQQRPITDALRRSVADDLPELGDIANGDLRRKAIEAWAFALSHSSFGRISDIPPGGNPGMNVLKRGSQADHLRGVAKLALQIADTFAAQRPEVRIDRDVVLCGALCHDVGKCYEFDPENQARWAEDPSATGQPTLRHTVFGTYVCLAVGL